LFEEDVAYTFENNEMDKEVNLVGVFNLIILIHFRGKLKK
jgi:hypothetical protein